MGSIPSLSEQETAQTFLDISNGVKFKRNVFFFYFCSGEVFDLFWFILICRFTLLWILLIVFSSHFAALIHCAFQQAQMKSLKRKLKFFLQCFLNNVFANPHFSDHSSLDSKCYLERNCQYSGKYFTSQGPYFLFWRLFQGKISGFREGKLMTKHRFTPLTLGIQIRKQSQRNNTFKGFFSLSPYVL